MPAEYTLRYLPVAQDDLRSILDFIAQDNPSRASSFIEELDTKIGLLEEQPHLGRTPRHPKLREYGCPDSRRLPRVLYYSRAND